MTADLPDVNLLLALVTQDHEHHALAADWLRETTHLALCPATESGLIRLLLNPVILPEPRSPQEALKAARLIRTLPSATFWEDSTALDESRFGYALKGFRQVTDLHLLTLAHSKGGMLVTLDKKIEAALRPADRRHVKILI